eukprot:TRINITY_DN10543_c0_g1_i5.p1 TRINITY_DN10543_c0_g1~~TRINITY_DN10543_c0_g1_i5.p1  ORF type:complete len:239 (+),score=78.37 TRINITY_DN10543_c0_g1_i5:68-718(+)
MPPDGHGEEGAVFIGSVSDAVDTDWLTRNKFCAALGIFDHKTRNRERHEWAQLRELPRVLSARGIAYCAVHCPALPADGPCNFMARHARNLVAAIISFPQCGDGRLLVFSTQGENRAPAAVAAYLVAALGMGLVPALRTISKQPNLGRPRRQRPFSSRALVRELAEWGAEWAALPPAEPCSAPMGRREDELRGYPLLAAQQQQQQQQAEPLQEAQH